MTPLGELKTIFVTGANRGIGLALVREFVKTKGVERIFAGCREPESAKDLSALGDGDARVCLVRVDVGSDQSVRSAVKEVESALGADAGLNMLVNNAGVMDKEGGITLQQPDRDAFLRHFDVNTVSVAITTAAFLPLLKRASARGECALVVNLSSGLGSISRMAPINMVPGKNVVYGMSKAALNHYTKALALDEPELVAVAIHPGWVKTDMGGQNAPVPVEQSASQIVKRICALKREDSGKFMDHERELTP